MSRFDIFQTAVLATYVFWYVIVFHRGMRRTAVTITVVAALVYFVGAARLKGVEAETLQSLILLTAVQMGIALLVATVCGLLARRFVNH